MKKNSRLSERFVLVHFTSHGWGGRKRDRHLADETARAQNAEIDAVDVIINLIDRKEFKGIEAAHGQAYREFCNKTIPWMAGGLRLLAAEDIMDWRKPVTDAVHRHGQEVEKFAQRWPELSSSKKMQKRLGKLSRRYKLPTIDEIRHRFGIHLDMYPVPEITDFRAKLINIGDEEAAEIRESVKASMKGLETEAMRKVWQELSVFIGRIAETMGTPNKGFRDTLLTNLRDFCEMLPKYNITGDAQLESVRQDALTQLAMDPEDLREVPIKRRKAAEDARKLVERISQYM